MERKELICIGCPLGCAITVTMDGGNVVSITGNTCKRGSDYAAILSPACASWDMFPSYEVRGRRFKELVRNL